MASAFTDKLLVHVDKMDFQHKKLFDAIESFHRACLNAKGKESIPELFAFLKNYTETHFKDEETLMITYHYPDFENHKKLHIDFIKKVNELGDTVKGGRIPLPTVININHFLTDWLINHISKTDKKLGEYLNEKM